MFRWLHYIGVALIFIAAALLLVTTVSAPVVGDLAILKVLLTNQTDFRHSSVTFGSFGHCILDVPPVTTDQDLCFPKVIGYQPAAIMSEIDGTTFSSAGADSADALTNAFVLHPVASALAFIAGIAALGGFFGSLVAMLIAMVAWLITVVVLAIDFSVFGVSNPHSCLPVCGCA
jgi:SUR7/PalI family